MSASSADTAAKLPQGRKRTKAKTKARARVRARVRAKTKAKARAKARKTGVKDASLKDKKKITRRWAGLHFQKAKCKLHPV